MDISMHANVTCFDGVVGKSTHIIVDLVKEEVSHFVVKTDHHSQQFVVPIEKVKDSDRMVILLDCRKEDVYQFLPFKETHFKGYDAYEGEPPAPAPGIAASYTLYQPYRASESGTHSPTNNDSLTELAVNKGAKVLATDGEVGKIDEFLINPDTHQITHLILRQHNIFGRWIVTIPVSDIEQVDMDSVQLKLDKAAIKELPSVALKPFSWEVL